jgi:hypothetical protein
MNEPETIHFNDHYRSKKHPQTSPAYTKTELKNAVLEKSNLNYSINKGQEHYTKRISL